MSLTFNNSVLISKFWTDFKSLAITSKLLTLQYDIDTDNNHQKYIIFAIDGDITYVCYIWLSTIPPDITGSYSQGQNDSDKADFENNYFANANRRLAPGLVQTVILENDTVTVGGSQTFAGFSNRQVSLFINVTQSPTGSGPGLQFTLQEIDPGDLTTSIGTSITGSSITSGPQTQVITLNLTTSSAIKVSWIIVGTSSPSFPGTYATLTSKPTTVFSGVDVNGVERVIQPDTNGRLMIVGSTSVGSAGTGNPVLMGGINSGGVAQYVSLSSDNSVSTTKGTNKQPIFINNTITTNGISNLTGIGDSTVNLFINVKNAPTGTNPTLTFSLYEIDPGDSSTAIRSTVTGAPISAAGTQVISLPIVSSGVVQVSWTVGGTSSPTFTGVYVTAIIKNSVTPLVYGDFYPVTNNSYIFEAVTEVSSGVGHGTSIGTTAPFTLYNPTSSTRNLVLLEVRMGYLSGTLGSGTVYLCANTNPAASAVTGTSITPHSTLIGSGASSQGQAFTTATLPATPTVLKPLWILTPMLASSVISPFQLSEKTDGKYVILPGCSLSFESVATSGSSPLVTFSMIWTEVPF